MSLSDNVELFSLTSNLNAAETWISNPLILGQYISLSAIGKSDQDLSVLFQFSGDGVNWDYNITKSMAAGSNSLLDTPVLAKWTRLQVTNSGVVPTTYLRLYVYGVPSNSSLVAQLGKIGNIDPAVQISNLPLSAFDELLTVPMSVESQYIFCKGTSGNMLTGTWVLPYSDIHTWSTATATTVGAQLYIQNGVVHFGENVLPGDRAILVSPPLRYRPGQGIIGRFTGYFYQGVKQVGGNTPTMEYIGIGNYNSSTNRPNDGYFFGYGDPNGSVTNFGIVYLNAGVRTFYPRTAWNGDKCDGTNVMPTLDFSKAQVYQISFQYLGFGAVRFYIENPTDGKMHLVHTINRVNSVISPTNLSNPSVGLIMFVESEAPSVPTVLNDDIGLGSFALFTQGISTAQNERAAFEATRSIAGAELPIMSLRCDTTFYGAQNYYGIDLDQISLSTDGTKTVYIRFYINSTLTGAVWSTPYSSILPISKDTTASMTSPGQYVTGIVMAKIDQYFIIDDHMHIHLNPGDILTVTASSAAATDVFVTMSGHIH